MIRSVRHLAKAAKLSVLTGLFAGLSLVSSTAVAQANYPNKPIRLIVGFAPGGGSDLIARLVAVKLGPVLGQTVIVENKPGAGINLLHVPYKGTAPALTDTVAGHTNIVFGTVASTLPLVKSNQLKALAVTTPARLAALPDVPTAKEAGYPSYEVTNWHGIIAPKGVPVAIQQKLNKAINQVLQDPEMEKTLTSDGLTAAALTPEEFGALLKSEIARWGAVAKTRGLSIK
jgi:tripartite-type tricarboxylate transporter receptor subunit TctC